MKVCSLFSGCGGIDKAVIGDFCYIGKKYSKNPFEIVYAVDNDKYAVEIYNKNFIHKCICEDIRNVSADDIPEHDLLVGGFPCQAFSIIAQNPPRLGFQDEKGRLFFEIIRILKVKKPSFFILENVKGLLSANNKMTFPLILKEFEGAGYHIKYKVLNSWDFGVPQKRERVFIIGFRDKLDFELFSFPQNIINSERKVLKHVISNNNVDMRYFFSDRAVAGMLRVKEKMNKGRVQDIESPCNTISAHLAKVSLNSTDPVLEENGKYRRFTPYEAARIQSFPDDFDFSSVSESRQYRAIGNAVPPVLMWHIIQSLILVINSRENNTKYTNTKNADLKIKSTNPKNSLFAISSS
jgi:DNA (cytosine-5)-methyltransferase 1